MLALPGFGLAVDEQDRNIFYLIGFIRVPRGRAKPSRRAARCPIITNKNLLIILHSSLLCVSVLLRWRNRRRLFHFIRLGSRKWKSGTRDREWKRRRLALLGDQGPAGHSQILGDASSKQGRLDRGNGFPNIRSIRRGVEPVGEPTDPRRPQTRFAYRLPR